MGIAGFTMPLLSTLAALVIIVHSAEENYEREYHMMRPRALDTRTNYDQPWRMVETGPTKTQQAAQITPRETWDEIEPAQSMRPRRARKRKRRPQLAGEDDLVPQERVYTYNEDSLPRLQENIERPRRRRKKMEFQNSDDEGQNSWKEDANRPKRRRGQKLKRPSADSWPEVAEFGGYREQTDGSEETTDYKEIHIDSIPDDENYNQKDINEKVDSKVQIYNKNDPEIEKTTQPMVNYDSQPQVATKNEESLSEFSIESIRPNEKPNKTRIDLQQKTREKGTMLSNNIEPPKIKTTDTDPTDNIALNLKTVPNERLDKNFEKIGRLNKRINEEYLKPMEDALRDKEPLDPFTLKALLKKSNGKSLSEILQQNNLSLADLLNGREKALSILKKESLTVMQDMAQSRHSDKDFYSPISSIENIETLNKNIESEKEEENEHVETETTTLITTTENLMQQNNNNNGYEESDKYNYQENEPVEIHRRGNLRRRFPGSIRRKLRTRPTENNTYKGQLSRDLIALTSLKYKNNRNLSKSREWKEVVPSMMKAEPPNVEAMTQIETETETITTTPCSFTETTTQEIFDTTTDPSYISINTEPIDDSREESETTTNAKSTYLEIEGIDIAQFTTTPVEVNTEQEKETITRKPKPIIRPLIKSSDLRRQALNNRLKRKHVKQRTSTTEIPEELGVKDTFGIGKVVSASEFITKTQKRTTNTVDEDDFMTLEDFLTTEATQKVPSRYRSKNPIKPKNTTAFTIQKIYVTTEETAKYEIEEILNDNHTSAKLSKILKERNMTLKELVEHRERGSSHVHLADIFHNASREPNPPEPFLSKSLIEPISKETYPLRALLEANLHDPRTTTIDPTVPQINNANIPVVMDFGNNVNENGENKGITSFFKNYSIPDTHKPNSSNESARMSYDTKNVKTNLNTEGIHGTSREARMLTSEKDSVTWNDLINLMQKNHQKENIDSEMPMESDPPISETLKKIALEEDLDGDGVIVLDDLQQLRNMERKTTSDKLMEFKIHERNNPLLISNNSNMVLNDTKSVTVATASIIGLALILFLLTYAILKWKQQNKIFHTKRGKEDEFVPTPVFENRKGHKMNSSTRSKSPMLATPNIYSIDTIDTHAGSESPEYMWDTLRKPFQ